MASYPLTYSARQLLRYHAYCRANPAGHVLPPGGQRDWDELSTAAWLRWFWSCLTEKTNRGIAPGGNGNRARRRAAELANARAECKWCGQPTGHVNRRFCDSNCARSYA